MTRSVPEPTSRGDLTWDPDWTESFDARVRFGEDHWLWEGYVNPNDGYGRFKPRHNMSGELAHRVAYVRWIGPIPDEAPVIDHLGHPFALRRCVRPDCLEAISHAENVRRGEGPTGINARRTHCPRCGSEYNPTNTVYRADGERRCRICRQRYKAARRAEAAQHLQRSPQASTSDTAPNPLES